MGMYVSGPYGSYPVYATTRLLTNPSCTVTFSDIGGPTLNYAGGPTRPPTCDYSINGYPYRSNVQGVSYAWHNERTNLCFADGHSETANRQTIFSSLNTAPRAWTTGYPR